MNSVRDDTASGVVGLSTAGATVGSDQPSTKRPKKKKAKKKMKKQAEANDDLDVVDEQPRSILTCPPSDGATESARSSSTKSLSKSKKSSRKKEQGKSEFAPDDAVGTTASTASSRRSTSLIGDNEINNVDDEVVEIMDISSSEKEKKMESKKKKKKKKPKDSTDGESMYVSTTSVTEGRTISLGGSYTSMTNASTSGGMSEYNGRGAGGGRRLDVDKGFQMRSIASTVSVQPLRVDPCIRNSDRTSASAVSSIRDMNGMDRNNGQQQPSLELTDQGRTKQNMKKTKKTKKKKKSSYSRESEAIDDGNVDGSSISHTTSNYPNETWVSNAGENSSRLMEKGCQMTSMIGRVQQNPGDHGAASIHVPVHQANSQRYSLGDDGGGTIIVATDVVPVVDLDYNIPSADGTNDIERQQHHQRYHGRTADLRRHIGTTNDSTTAHDDDNYDDSISNDEFSTIQINYEQVNRNTATNSDKPEPSQQTCLGTQRFKYGVIVAVLVIVVVVVVSVVVTQEGSNESAPSVPPTNGNFASDPTATPITSLPTTTSSPSSSPTTSQAEAVLNDWLAPADITVDEWTTTLGVETRNILSGTIPTEIGILTSLTLFILRNQGRLVSTIPTEIGLLTSMKNVGIEGSTVFGTIPTEIGLLTDMRQFLLSNRMSGTIPTEIGLLTALSRATLYSTRLDGPIPSQLGMLTDLVFLDLGNNSLRGTIPSELGLITSLTYLDLFASQLTGTIPTEVQALVRGGLHLKVTLPNTPSPIQGGGLCGGDCGTGESNNCDDQGCICSIPIGHITGICV